MDENIKVEISMNEVINFSIWQNLLPIINSITIENTSENELKNIKIKITSEPDFCIDYEQNIDFISAKDKIVQREPRINLSTKFLYELDERVTGVINIKVFVEDELCFEENKTIAVLSHNEWSGMTVFPELITSFSMPNNKSITQIITKADEILKGWDEKLSFNAYQSNNPNNIKKQIGAVYSAIQSLDISYIIAPASYEYIGQKIRFADEILANKLANCLDLTMLFCSVLEAIGLNPIILFYKSHANIACWLDNKTYPEIIQDDTTVLTNRMIDGINEIIILEPTCICKGNVSNFETSIKFAKEKLISEEDFELAIDVKRARLGGFRPIPLLKKINDNEFDYTEFESKDNENNVEFISAPTELIEVIKGGEGNVANNFVQNDKQKVWERNLLDLSLRNTLLNFRVTKNSIQLICNNLSDLEDHIASGEEFVFMSAPKDFKLSFDSQKIGNIENKTDDVEALITSEFTNNRIRTYVDEVGLDRAITRTLQTC